MHSKRKKRLIWLCFVLIGLSGALGFTLQALKKNINLFLTPTRVEAGEAPVGRAFRLGGMVKPGSIQRNPNSLKVRFILTDFTQEIWVTYEGVLPDLFKENQGVVVHGEMDEHNEFIADEVLAKHDENYKPPM